MGESSVPWPRRNRPAVILSTGAMNPPHLGHAMMLHQAAERLKQDNWTVIEAYMSPTHDGYVLPKARNLKTLGLSGRFRFELAKRALEGDGLVQASPFEVFQDAFVDFPQVAEACQKEFKDQAKVFYVCGTDHAKNCGLTRCGIGNEIPVVVVPRAGEAPPSEVPGMVLVAEPAADAFIAALSSTKVRQAMKAGDKDYLSSALSPSAATFLLEPTQEQEAEFKTDFDEIRNFK
eukprot:TRINITY_DN11593_c0_g1_i1.p1 TRINITY_DN11593_c0_g1~~TRINITY_DN11593_c0_g1_i1.p1  ORF type:complete len:233 (+),score=53.81 TRINITY_DN11593_c0_g1_i1:68-766(+)